MSDIAKSPYSHEGKLLINHLEGVTTGVARFDGLDSGLARVAAIFHDLGKLNPNFQDKLGGKKLSSGSYSNHSFLSALIFLAFCYENKDVIKAELGAEDLYAKARAIITIITKHHGNLPNFSQIFSPSYGGGEFSKLKKFLEQNRGTEILEKLKKSLEEYFKLISNLFGEKSVVSRPENLLDLDLEKSLHILESYAGCSEVNIKKNAELKPVDFFLEVRFAFGLLLDSDKRDASENNLDPSQKEKERKNFRKDFQELLKKRFKKLTDNSVEANKTLNKLRTSMREEANTNLKKILEENPQQRIFSLTAPTGAGKTYMLLSLASILLEKDEKLAGIIYALPFLSITEQVTDICENIFGKELWVARIDSKSANETIEKLQEKLDEKLDEDVLSKLLKEKYAENTFEKELIITTFVQFFEALLSNRNSVCMKLPNFANRIFLIDEIQSLPPRLYTFFVRLLEAFCKKFNSYAIISTATMPKFEFPEGESKQGEIIARVFPDIKPIPELVDYEPYFERTEFNRYQVKKLGEINLDRLIEHIKSESKGKSCLIVLNTIADSQRVYSELKKLNDNKNTRVILLNTRFIVKDRQKKIRYVKRLLKHTNRQVILVTTQLIEAGVDISFPIAYRDLCPLPNLIQICGRTNRNNEYLEKGKIYFFTLIDSKDKKRAELIYEKKDHYLLKKAEELISDSNWVSESELFGKQEEYFSYISQNMMPGRYSDNNNDKNLIEEINTLAFETVGKFELIEKKHKEVSYYVPDNKDCEGAGEAIFQEIEKILELVYKTKFPEKAKYLIRLDQLRKKLAQRTVTLRIQDDAKLPESKKELLGIRLLTDDLNYSQETGLDGSITEECRII